ncbi:uncharacterized protein LOC134299127 [Anolis carolinensis]|uniref:uncharacterized protein LOC134299127 n=1 Tax=Anolis carolinensis TaxID=28377 RepID=UPI002F2B2D09
MEVRGAIKRPMPPPSPRRLRTGGGGINPGERSLTLFMCQKGKRRHVFAQAEGRRRREKKTAGSRREREREEERGGGGGGWRERSAENREGRQAGRPARGEEARSLARWLPALLPSLRPSLRCSSLAFPPVRSLVGSPFPLLAPPPSLLPSPREIARPSLSLPSLPPPPHALSRARLFPLLAFQGFPQERAGAATVATPTPCGDMREASHKDGKNIKTSGHPLGNVLADSQFFHTRNDLQFLKSLLT